MVSTTEGVGLAFVSASVVASLVTLVCTWKHEDRFVSTMTMLGSTIIPAALVPQLIKNQMAGRGMDRFTSPFFLLAYPVSILGEIVGQWDSIKKATDPSVRRNRWVGLAGMFIRLLLYTAWLGQYASHGHYTIVLGLITAAFSITMVIAGVLVCIHRGELISGTRNTHQYGLM